MTKKQHSWKELADHLGLPALDSESDLPALDLDAADAPKPAPLHQDAAPSADPSENPAPHEVTAFRSAATPSGRPLSLLDDEEDEDEPLGWSSRTRASEPPRQEPVSRSEPSPRVEATPTPIPAEPPEDKQEPSAPQARSDEGRGGGTRSADPSPRRSGFAALDEDEDDLPIGFRRPGDRTEPSAPEGRTASTPEVFRPSEPVQGQTPASDTTAPRRSPRSSTFILDDEDDDLGFARRPAQAARPVESREDVAASPTDEKPAARRESDDRPERSETSPGPRPRRRPRGEESASVESEREPTPPRESAPPRVTGFSAAFFDDDDDAPIASGVGTQEPSRPSRSPEEREDGRRPRRRRGRDGGRDDESRPRSQDRPGERGPDESQPERTPRRGRQRGELDDADVTPSHGSPRREIPVTHGQPQARNVATESSGSESTGPRSSGRASRFGDFEDDDDDSRPARGPRRDRRRDERSGEPPAARTREGQSREPQSRDRRPPSDEFLAAESIPTEIVDTAGPAMTEEKTDKPASSWSRRWNQLRETLGLGGRSGDAKPADPPATVPASRSAPSRGPQSRFEDTSDAPSSRDDRPRGDQRPAPTSGFSVGLDDDDADDAPIRQPRPAGRRSERSRDRAEAVSERPVRSQDEASSSRGRMSDGDDDLETGDEDAPRGRRRRRRRRRTDGPDTESNREVGVEADVEPSDRVDVNDLENGAERDEADWPAEEVSDLRRRRRRRRRTTEGSPDEADRPPQDQDASDAESEPPRTRRRRTRDESSEAPRRRVRSDATRPTRVDGDDDDDVRDEDDAPRRSSSRHERDEAAWDARMEGPSEDEIRQSRARSGAFPTWSEAVEAVLTKNLDQRRDAPRRNPRRRG